MLEAFQHHPRTQEAEIPRFVWSSKYLGQGYYLTDEEFQQELAKRRERLRLTEGQTVIGCPLCGYSKPLADQQP